MGFIEYMLILFVATTCYSQEYKFQVTVNLQTCIGSIPCLTLNGYAQNKSFPHSSVKLLLEPGEHKLSKEFIIENATDFSIVPANNSSRVTVVDCGQTGYLGFYNTSAITVEGITFLSCGTTDQYGIDMSGIDGLSFVKVILSHSEAEVLHIKNSYNSILINDLSIENNHYLKSTIVLFENSNVNLTGTTAFRYNIIGGSELNCKKTFKEVSIFQIDDCNINIEHLVIKNNTSPNGVVKVNGTKLSGRGSWYFDFNQVCNCGSLLLDGVSAMLIGNMTFTNNFVYSQNVSGILIQNSTLNISGSAEFLYSRGFQIIDSTDSNINILGLFNLSYSSGNKGMHLKMGSLLNITGCLDLSHNALSDRALNAEFQSNIIVIGETICSSNSLSTPIVLSFTNMTLSGQITFFNNTGVLYAVVSGVRISGVSRFINNTLIDDFIDGTIAIERSYLELNGEYLFENNQIQKANKDGGAIYANVQCKIHFSGNGNFTGNSARYGGALFFYQLTTIEIAPGTNLVFHQNKAFKGGAIFIQTILKYVTCNSVSDDCFFKLPNNSSNDISLTFTDNNGNPGGSVIHANIDNIDFTKQNQTFPAMENLNSTIILPDTSNTNPRYFSESYLFCFCTKGSKQNCEMNRQKDIVVTKGKKFVVSVRAIRFYGDHYDEPVRSNLESSLGAEDATASSTNISSLEGCFQVVHNEKCAELEFTVTSALDQDSILLNIGESFLNENKTLRLNVIFEESCPVGFTLNSDNTSCVCDPRLAKHLSCDLEKDTFKTIPGEFIFWIGVYEELKDNSTSLLSYNGCPQGYCISNGLFTLYDDSICTNNRTGQLCGECIDGCSLLFGGVKCDDCSDKNAYVALLIVFAALGVVLVALIFLLQVTVTAGTVYGLILYFNIIAVNRDLFLPSDFFSGYKIFISWLNLHFGVENICFYDGMNQIQYAVWQYVFPVYLWLMVGVIVVVCRCSVRVATFFGGSDPVAVLATIILLTYNTLVQNVINTLSFAHLVKNDGFIGVWLYDGEIEFATGWHLLLVIFSLIFFVIFFMPFTLVLTFSQVLQKCNYTSVILRRLRFVHFIDAYQVSFKPAHRYWVGLCLMMRAILLVIFGLTDIKETPLLAIITFCVVSLSMLGLTGGVYEKHWLNLLEISFVLNLGLFSAFRLYLNDKKYISILAYASVTVAFATFLVIVAYHVFQRLKKQHTIKKAIKTLKAKLKIKKKKESNISTTYIEAQTVADNYNTHLREPLLESQN